MDIQHTAVVWRLLFDRISALNNQNWISFLVFAAGICIYCVEGDSSHGSSRAFSANRGGVAGHPDVPGNALALPQIKGLIPHAFTPHTDSIFVCWKSCTKSICIPWGSALFQDTFLTRLNLQLSYPVVRFAPCYVRLTFSSPPITIPTFYM